MKLLHQTQQDVLSYLLFHPRSRFGEIKPYQMDNSKFTFHLDQLIAKGFIQKEIDGMYSLTMYGKEEANRHDAGSKTPRIQSKLSVVFCCKNESTDQYLFYQRKKEPYFDMKGFPTGKVRFGELFCDAAKRKLHEETGLNGHPQMLDIMHIVVRDKASGELLEDKTMGICLIKNPEGTIYSEEGAVFFWEHLTTPIDGDLLPETALIIKVLLGERLEKEHILLTSYY